MISFFFNAFLISLYNCLLFYFIVPDKVTTSLRSRPTSLNFEMMVSSVSNGEGIARFASVPFEINPSLRPSWTYQKGPPLCKNVNTIMVKKNTNSINREKSVPIKRGVSFFMNYQYLTIEHTRRTESLAAMANISAQDTTPLHARSTELLIVSITSNPLA